MKSDIISDEEIECFKFMGREFFNDNAGSYLYFLHLLKKFAFIDKKQLKENTFKDRGDHDSSDLGFARDFSLPQNRTECDDYIEVKLSFCSRFSCVVHIDKKNSTYNQLNIIDGKSGAQYYLHDPDSSLYISDLQTLYLLKNSKSIVHRLSVYDQVVDEIHSFKLKVQELLKTDMEKYNFTGFFEPSKTDYRTMKDQRALTYTYGKIDRIDENEIVYFKEEKKILIPVYNYMPALEVIRADMSGN